MKNATEWEEGNKVTCAFRLFSGTNLTAPSTPNSVAPGPATTPKGIPSVGNSLDQSGQENDTGSMSDDLALQSLLTAATASVATSSAADTPSTTPSGMCMSLAGGDPMDSLRGVTDLLDGSGSSLLGLDTSTGSVGGGGGGNNCMSNNGGMLGPGDMLGGGMPMGGNNNMSNVQMGGMGGMPQQPQQQVGGMAKGGGGGGGSCQMGNAGGMGGNSMDNTYMQNRIFVFSTQMANKGAEMVINGHFLSIIAYHCSQPETKKILEVS